MILPRPRSGQITAGVFTGIALGFVSACGVVSAGYQRAGPAPEPQELLDAPTYRDAVARADASAEQRLSEPGDTDGSAPPAPAATEPWALGDDPVLDDLWRQCEHGRGAACDQLFNDAPLGSDYETFGLSCGNRPDLLRCAELDTD